MSTAEDEYEESFASASSQTSRSRSHRSSSAASSTHASTSSSSSSRSTRSSQSSTAHHDRRGSTSHGDTGAGTMEGEGEGEKRTVEESAKGSRRSSQHSTSSTASSPSHHGGGKRSPSPNEAPPRAAGDDSDKKDDDGPQSSRSSGRGTNTSSRSRSRSTSSRRHSDAASLAGASSIGDAAPGDATTITTAAIDEQALAALAGGGTSTGGGADMAPSECSLDTQGRQLRSYFLSQRGGRMDKYSSDRTDFSPNPNLKLNAAALGQCVSRLYRPETLQRRTLVDLERRRQAQRLDQYDSGNDVHLQEFWRRQRSKVKGQPSVGDPATTTMSSDGGCATPAAVDLTALEANATSPASRASPAHPDSSTGPRTRSPPHPHAAHNSTFPKRAPLKIPNYHYHPPRPTAATIHQGGTLLPESTYRPNKAARHLPGMSTLSKGGALQRLAHALRPPVSTEPAFVVVFEAPGGRQPPPRGRFAPPPDSEGQSQDGGATDREYVHYPRPHPQPGEAEGASDDEHHDGDNYQAQSPGGSSHRSRSDASSRRSTSHSRHSSRSSRSSRSRSRSRSPPSHTGDESTYTTDDNAYESDFAASSCGAGGGADAAGDGQSSEEESDGTHPRPEAAGPAAVDTLPASTAQGTGKAPPSKVSPAPHKKDSTPLPKRTVVGEQDVTKDKSVVVTKKEQGPPTGSVGMATTAQPTANSTGVSKTTHRDRHVSRRASSVASSATAAAALTRGDLTALWLLVDPPQNLRSVRSLEIADPAATGIRLDWMAVRRRTARRIKDELPSPNRYGRDIYKLECQQQQQDQEHEKVRTAAATAGTGGGEGESPERALTHRLLDDCPRQEVSIAPLDASCTEDPSTSSPQGEAFEGWVPRDRQEEDASRLRASPTGAGGDGGRPPSSGPGRGRSPTGTGSRPGTGAGQRATPSTAAVFAGPLDPSVSPADLRDAVAVAVVEDALEAALHKQLRHAESLHRMASRRIASASTARSSTGSFDQRKKFAVNASPYSTTGGRRQLSTTPPRKRSMRQRKAALPAAAGPKGANHSGAEAGPTHSPHSHVPATFTTLLDVPADIPDDSSEHPEAVLRLGTMAINSPRSALVLLRRGLTLAELLPTPLYQCLREGAAEHALPVAMERRFLAKEARRRRLLATARADYEEICAGFSREAVVDAFHAADPSNVPSAEAVLAAATNSEGAPHATQQVDASVGQAAASVQAMMRSRVQRSRVKEARYERTLMRQSSLIKARCRKIKDRDRALRTFEQQRAADEAARREERQRQREVHDARLREVRQDARDMEALWQQDIQQKLDANEERCRRHAEAERERKAVLNELSKGAARERAERVAQHDRSRQYQVLCAADRSRLKLDRIEASRALTEAARRRLQDDRDHTRRRFISLKADTDADVLAFRRKNDV